MQTPASFQWDGCFFKGALFPKRLEQPGSKLFEPHLGPLKEVEIPEFPEFFLPWQGLEDAAFNAHFPGAKH